MKKFIMRAYHSTKINTPNPRNRKETTEFEDGNPAHGSRQEFKLMARDRHKNVSVVNEKDVL